MIPEHEAAVRASWTEFASRADEVAARFHARFLAFDPAARALLAATDPEAHRRKLAGVLTEMAEALDNPERLVAVLVALARRHAGYSIRGEQIARAGDALIEALRESLGAQFTAEVEGAWRELVELVEAVMRRAVEGTDGQSVGRTVRQGEGTEKTEEAM